MGWLLNALANLALEIIADLMTWTVSLVSGLNLDIGMDSNARGTTVLPLGTYIMPTVPKSNLFDNLLPQASSFTTLFMVLAAVIIAFLFSMKLMLAFGGPFTKSEKAGTIYIRTALAVAGTAYSYSIFLFFESMFNGVYQRFMNKYTDITSGAGSFALDLDNAGAAGSKEDAFNMMSEKLIKDYETGAGLGLSLLVIALFTVLLVSFFRLVLEIYERYVMLGVLFYTSPLAFSTIVSREMNVFSSWVQMVISEFVVMCSNLFFTGVFISSWTNLLTEGKSRDYLFATPQEFITTMFIMISWLLIGQQFDQHLKTLGLSTAQTGRGLGGALAAGFGTAAAAARMGLGAMNGLRKTGEKALVGQTGIQKAWRDGTGVPGAFRSKLDEAGLVKDTGDGILSDINEQHAKGYSDPDNAAFLMDNINDKGFQNSEDFQNLSGSDLTDAMKTAGGQDLDNYLRSNYGAGVDAINPDNTYYAPFTDSNGEQGGTFFGTVGSGENQREFQFDVGSAESSAYTSMPIGDNFSVPVTSGEAFTSSENYANKLNTVSGKNTHWDVDKGDSRYVTRSEKNESGGWDISSRVANPAFEKQLNKAPNYVGAKNSPIRNYNDNNVVGGPGLSAAQRAQLSPGTGASAAGNAARQTPGSPAVNIPNKANTPASGDAPRRGSSDMHNIDSNSNDVDDNR